MTEVLSGRIKFYATQTDGRCRPKKGSSSSSCNSIFSLEGADSKIITYVCGKKTEIGSVLSSSGEHIGEQLNVEADEELVIIEQEVFDTAAKLRTLELLTKAKLEVDVAIRNFLDVRPEEDLKVAVG